MPRKIRQLEADLLQAGFRLESGRGKGGHRGFFHSEVPNVKVILSGNRGDDAKPYQERQVREAIAEVESWRTSRDTAR